MEGEMRLKEADCPVDMPECRLNTHNVVHRNQNQSVTRGKLPDSGVIHCSTQWASNYVTSPNTSTCTSPTPGKEIHRLTYNGSNFNNNVTASFQQQHRSSYSTSPEYLSESSPDDSLGDFEDGQHCSSSLDVSPQQDEYRCFNHEELSESDSSDEGNCRGIVNPNYPGFQHLARHLHNSDTDDTEDEGDTCNNNNNNYKNNNNNNNNGDDHIDDFRNATESKIDSVNHLDSVENFQKDFYDKPKFNIPVDSDLDLDCVGNSDCISVVPLDRKYLNVLVPESDIVPEDCAKIVVNTEEAENSAEIASEVLVTNMAAIAVTNNTIATSPGIDAHQINSSKMSDAFLSGAKEDLFASGAPDEGSIRIKRVDGINSSERVGLCADDCNSRKMEDSNRVVEEWEEKEKAIEKFSKEEQTASEKEKDDDSVVPRKKEKMEINYSVKKKRSSSCTSKMELQPSAPVLQQEQSAGAVVRRHDFGSRGTRDHVLANRRSVPTGSREKKHSTTEILGIPGLQVDVIPEVVLSQHCLMPTGPICNGHRVGSSRNVQVVHQTQHMRVKPGYVHKVPVILHGNL